MTRIVHKPSHHPEPKYLVPILKSGFRGAEHYDALLKTDRTKETDAVKLNQSHERGTAARFEQKSATSIECKSTAVDRTPVPVNTCCDQEPNCASKNKPTEKPPTKRKLNQPSLMKFMHTKQKLVELSTDIHQQSTANFADKVQLSEPAK